VTNAAFGDPQLPGGGTLAPLIALKQAIIQRRSA
jgi:hypothetical protein